MLKGVLNRVMVTAMALCMLAVPALGETVLEGEIEAVQAVTIKAPYSGTVDDYAVRIGESLKAGDVLFPISTTRVYADTDGTVTGLFAHAGENAETVSARYGALCYIERDVLFEAACSIAGADGDTQDKIVHPGETVYLKSTNNSSRDGVGRVTSVSGDTYMVEITMEGDLNLNDPIKVYRDSDHDSDSCIGSGRTSRIDPIAVNAQGSVLRIAVKDGQRVARGDLLFEIVPDALDGLVGGASAALMPQDGVLLTIAAQSGAQVAKDDALATYCPAGAVELVCGADEDDLADLRIGAHVKVMLEAYPDMPVDGTIRCIAAAADEDGEYEVCITLADLANVRIGMSAEVSF